MTWSDTLEVILYFHYEYVGAIWWYFCESFCELYPEAKCLQSENYFLVYSLATFVGSLGWKLFMVPVYNVFFFCFFTMCLWHLRLVHFNTKLKAVLVYLIEQLLFYEPVSISFIPSFGFSKARSPSDKRGVCVTGISSQKYDKICIKLVKLFRGVNYK